MKLLFASDFHLGARRQAGFTAESAQRREDYSYQLLSEILDGTPHDVAICCGDYFDRFTNPETEILRAFALARRFALILPGNHDLTNREGVVGSLELIQHLNSKIELERRGRLCLAGPNTQVWAIPHQLTQTGFMQELERIEREAAQSPPAYKFLLLHCNYNSPFELSESSLHLTRERAGELLATFHYVLLGHEHRALDDYDGRLRVIGSHLPTTLDDFTDKRHLLFDTGTGDLSSITHWSAATHTYSGPAAGAPTGRQFYTLTECENPKTVVELFKGGAFGVRLVSSERSEQTPLQVAPRLHQLPELIRAELAERPELLELWEELCA